MLVSYRMQLCANAGLDQRR